MRNILRAILFDGEDVVFDKLIQANTLSVSEDIDYSGLQNLWR